MDNNLQRIFTALSCHLEILKKRTKNEKKHLFCQDRPASGK